MEHKVEVKDMDQPQVIHIHHDIHEVIGIQGVMRMFNCSRSTAHRYTKQGWFPSPVDLGDGIEPGWLKWKVIEALESRPAGNKGENRSGRKRAVNE